MNLGGNLNTIFFVYVYPKNMSNRTVTDLTILNTLESWYNLPAETQIDFRKFCVNLGVNGEYYTAINNVKRLADCHSEPMKFVQNQTSLLLAKLALTPLPESDDETDSEDSEKEEEEQEQEQEQEEEQEEQEQEQEEQEQAQDTNMIQELDAEPLEELTTKTQLQGQDVQNYMNDIPDLLLAFFLFTVSFPLIFYNLLILFAAFRPAN